MCRLRKLFNYLGYTDKKLGTKTRAMFGLLKFRFKVEGSLMPFM